jgi:hypothetical protein
LLQEGDELARRLLGSFLREEVAAVNRAAAEPVRSSSWIALGGCGALTSSVREGLKDAHDATMTPAPIGF